VKNQEKDLDTCAVVEQKRHLGLIREESFEVKECGMLAVDHAAIIVQALTILQERCG
jgi:8-oxo-dGTP diphosphatase